MINKYIVLFVFNIFLATCAQILLKTSANKEYNNKIREYLNPYVLGGYSIFVINTLVSIYCYRYLELKQGGVLQMSGFVFILILGRIFMNERITTKKILGITLIMSGILVFYIS